MWFSRCPRGLEPQFREHSHLSVITGPDSRVASYVGGCYRFQWKLHPSTLSPQAGRAPSAARFKASIWPVSQAKALPHGGLAGRQLAQPAEYCCFPHTWSGAG